MIDQTLKVSLRNLGADPKYPNTLRFCDCDFTQCLEAGLVDPRLRVRGPSDGPGVEFEDSDSETSTWSPLSYFVSFLPRVLPWPKRRTSLLDIGQVSFFHGSLTSTLAVERREHRTSHQLESIQL